MVEERKASAGWTCGDFCKVLGVVLLIVSLLMTGFFEISNRLECCSLHDHPTDPSDLDFDDGCSPISETVPTDSLGSCQWKVGLDWRIKSFGFQPLLSFRVHYFGFWNQLKQKHGPGIFFSLSGCRYVGSWEADKRHGLGLFISDDNSRWFGHWDQDQLTTSFLPYDPFSSKQSSFDPNSSPGLDAFVVMSQNAWERSLPLEAVQQITSVSITTSSSSSNTQSKFEIHKESKKKSCVVHGSTNALVLPLFEKAEKSACCPPERAQIAALHKEIKASPKDSQIGSCFLGSLQDGLMQGEGIVELPFSFWIQGRFEAGSLHSGHGFFGRHGSSFEGSIVEWQSHVSFGSSSLTALVSIVVPSRLSSRCLFFTNPDLSPRANSTETIVWALKTDEGTEDQQKACLSFSQDPSVSPLSLLSDLSILLRWHEYYLTRTNPIVQVSNYQFSPPPAPSPTP